MEKFSFKKNFNVETTYSLPLLYTPPTLGNDQGLPSYPSYHALADRLGASHIEIESIYHLEKVFHFLDTYTSTNEAAYLEAADADFAKAIKNLPEDVQLRVIEHTTAVTLFMTGGENEIRAMISRNRYFWRGGIIKFFARRGRESDAYSSVLEKLIVRYPDFQAGFRHFHAMKCMTEDSLNSPARKKSGRPNTWEMLNGNGSVLADIAVPMLTNSRNAEIPKDLRRVIEHQHRILMANLLAH